MERWIEFAFNKLPILYSIFNLTRDLSFTQTNLRWWNMEVLWRLRTGTLLENNGKINRLRLYNLPIKHSIFNFTSAQGIKHPRTDAPTDNNLHEKSFKSFLSEVPKGVSIYCEYYLKYWSQGISRPLYPLLGHKFQCLIKWAGFTGCGGSLRV